MVKIEISGKKNEEKAKAINFYLSEFSGRETVNKI